MSSVTPARPIALRKQAPEITGHCRAFPEIGEPEHDLDISRLVVPVAINLIGGQQQVGVGVRASLGLRWI